MVFCSDRFLAKPGFRRSPLERFTLLDPAKEDPSGSNTVFHILRCLFDNGEGSLLRPAILSGRGATASIINSILSS